LEMATDSIAREFEFNEYRHSSIKFADKFKKTIDQFFGSRKFIEAVPSTLRLTVSCHATKLLSK